MQKVIDISNDIVYIGNDDGSLQEVRLMDCSFEPKIGDSVNVFANESKVIVIKVESPTVVDLTNDKIHINIINENKPTSVQSYAQGKKVVNKVAYCLLAFFLGGIGVHKFYSGKIGLGFVYLIFFWTYIPAIISLIEFIIALTKSADDQGNILV